MRLFSEIRLNNGVALQNTDDEGQQEEKIRNRPSYFADALMVLPPEV